MIRGLKVLKNDEFHLVCEFLQKTFSSPTHWPDWNVTIQEYYKSNFYYYAAFENEALIGICPIHEIKNGLKKQLYSGQFHYIPYGSWIINRDVIITESFFRLKFNEAFTGFALPANSRFPLQYKLNILNHSFSTLLIDLENDEEWLWKNTVDSKRRNMIRKAEKNNLQMETVSEQNFNIFYGFYHTSNQRYGLSSLSSGCLSDLFFRTINITFKAMWIKREEDILSAIVIVHDKDYALYWLGLNTAGAPNLGQGEWLQWESIKYAKKQGCKLYDLCYIEKERLSSIYEFKKGFSQNEVPIVNFGIKPLSYRIINKLTK